MEHDGAHIRLEYANGCEIRRLFFQFSDKLDIYHNPGNCKSPD